MKAGDLVKLRWGDTIRSQLGIGLVLRAVPALPRGPYSKTSPYIRCDVLFSGTGTVEGLLDSELVVL